MSLERSPEYLKKLEEVRRMPQSFGRPEETPEETWDRSSINVEKREAARLLRMEVLLDNASCARFMVQSLEKNPEITVEELRAQVAHDAKVIYPEVLEAFAEELVSTSQRVKTAIEDLKARSEKKHQGMAKLLYRQLLTHDLRNSKPEGRALPHGEVKLGGEFPLAVQLDIEKESDYLAIKDERHVRVTKPEDLKFSHGHHAPVAPDGSVSAMLAEFAGNHVDFPVIVVRPGTEGSDTWTVHRHEQGHAQQNAFQKTLESQGKKFVWGEPGWEAGVDNWKLQTLWEEDEGKARNSIYWKKIQQHAATAAKREFFADAVAGEGYRLNSRSMNRLQYGEYDYFTSFGIDPKSSLHDALRQEYLKMLEVATSRFSDIVKSYAIMGLRDRVELMHWVAGQIPLEDWGKQLVEANFQWEANRLARINRFYCESARSDNEMEKERRFQLLEKMTSELERRQAKSFLPVLDRYEKQFNIPENFV